MEEELEEIIKKYIENNLTLEIDTESEWNEDNAIRFITSVRVELWLANKRIATCYGS